MTQLRYQPVSAPNLGNAASTIIDAGKGISEGLATIGTGLTNLAARREARQKEEYGRKQAQLLEAIGLEAAKINDEDSLNKLMSALSGVPGVGPAAAGTPAGTSEATGQGGTGNAAVPGVAAILSARQDSIIDQARERADTEGVKQSTLDKREITRGNRIGNDTSQLALDTATNQAAFQKNEAGTLAEITRLALAGDADGAFKLGKELSDRSANEYGADVVSSTLRGIYGDVGLGDDARTKVTTNAISIDQANANVGLTEAQTANTYASAANTRALTDQTNQSITIKNYEWSRDVAADQRADTEREEGKAIDDAAARILQSALEPEDAYLAADKEDLSPTARLLLKDKIAAATADPNWQDKYQPLDPFTKVDRNYRPEDAFINGDRPLSEAPSWNFGSIKVPIVPNTNSNLDVPRVVSTIEGNVQQLIESSDETVALYGDVVKYENELAGSTGNLQQMLSDKYREFFRNDADLNKFYEQVRKVQEGADSELSNPRRLTNAEMMAIADRALKKRGANFPGDVLPDGIGFGIPGVNLLPGNERADQFTFKGNKLSDIADSYRSQNIGELRGKYTSFTENATRARELGAKITQMQESRARAIQRGDDKAKAKYDGLLTDALDELAGINAKVDKTISTPKGKK